MDQEVYSSFIDSSDGLPISMLYLGKVSRQSAAPSVQLQLLAHQADDSRWVLVPQDAPCFLAMPASAQFGEGILVLFSWDGHGDIENLQEATSWVLGLVSDYLTQGITPEFLRQEMERAEQWRQSLTLQSQEVRRRALETAARREEIQELAKNLKLEREQQAVQPKAAEEPLTGQT